MSHAVTERTCRLYLLLPAHTDDAFAGGLAGALQAGDVACVLMRAGPDGTADRARADTLMTVAHANGVAFLVEADIEAAAAVGADGVHIPADEALYARARAALGPDAIVGAGAGLSRHDALVAAELGADYVAFGTMPGRHREDLAGLIAWWAELVEIPCVAWDMGSTAQAREAASLGADFVALGDPIWSRSVTPAMAVADVLGALARARDAA